MIDIRKVLIECYLISTDSTLDKYWFIIEMCYMKWWTVCSINAVAFPKFQEFFFRLRGNRNFWNFETWRKVDIREEGFFRIFFPHGEKNSQVYSVLWCLKVLNIVLSSGIKLGNGHIVFFHSCHTISVACYLILEIFDDERPLTYICFRLFPYLQDYRFPQSKFSK